jgi:hypothetical protein
MITSANLVSILTNVSGIGDSKVGSLSSISHRDCSRYRIRLGDDLEITFVLYLIVGGSPCHSLTEKSFLIAAMESVRVRSVFELPHNKSVDLLTRSTASRTWRDVSRICLHGNLTQETVVISPITVRILSVADSQ